MAPHKPGKSSAVRIIGGTWRSRKLTFPTSEELRPTADRIRETLFNWLADKVAGARCLDLFAGTGALGMEAVSRGASHCVWVENSRQNCNAIKTHLQTLNITEGTCVQTDALQFLDQCRHQFQAMDIVFLDPPFNNNWLEPVCSSLESNDWLTENASIYVESSRREVVPTLPDTWQPFREKVAGEVRYQLFVRSA